MVAIKVVTQSLVGRIAFESSNIQTDSNPCKSFAKKPEVNRAFFLFSPERQLNRNP